MKKKHIFGLVVLLLLLALLLFAAIITRQKTGGEDGVAAMLEKLGLKKIGNKRLLEKQLIEQVWIGNQIEMPGLNAYAGDIFGSELVLTFKRDGSCLLEYADQVVKARWRIKDTKIQLKGGIRTEGFLNLDWQTKALDSVYLLSIENYAVLFSSQAEIERIEKKIAEEEKKREEGIKELLNSSKFDLATCQPEFVALLYDYDFTKFQPVLLEEADKEDFLKEHFAPLLALGLQNSSWRGRIEQQDIEKILAGYELYEFNLKLTDRERKEKAGQEVLVPLEQVAAFIRPCIRIKEDRIVDVLAEMLQASQRYSRAEHALKMQVKKDAKAAALPTLAGAWQLKEKTVIHVFHGDGDKPGDHAWFLLAKNSPAACPTYLGGSAQAEEEN